ncbi:ATP-binding protein [uncultured Tenacibaculum sp.]|uniref:tetratricopeptide repeat-containing sensor histidine kinase n=1 Tax=uncultured Tenacibaculum sp. TaxID=174713 RepID=UPI00260A5681|nr:ATP-binding protein [uncultured Tenacibaculum sp.]
MKVKAESAHSALTSYSYIQKVQDSTSIRVYEYANILYEQENYTKSLEKILPLANKDLGNKILEAKVSLLIGKLLLEDLANKSSFNTIGDSLLNRIEEELVKDSIGKTVPIAFKYLKKSLKTLDSNNFISETNEDQDVLKADIYFLMSTYYSRKKKLDSAKYYLKKISDINNVSFEILGFKAKTYSHLGNIAVLEDSLSIAERYMRKSIQINTDLEENMSVALGYTNLATVYIQRKEYKKGRELYGEALTFLENEKSLKAVRYKEILYDNIAWALYNLKDYTAYDFVTKSYAIRDSLKDNELKKELNRILAKNDVNIVQEKADEQQSKQEQKTWIVGTTGVLISILLLYLANLYKLRQRNLSLKLSQNELRQQRRLERLNSQAQVKILNATLDGKETERKQIAEILHDNVSALLSSANMHLEATQKQYGDNIPEELQKTQQIITEASEKIRDLSHNLVSSILLKFGLEYAIKDVAKKFSNSEIKISTAISNVYRYSQDFEIKVFNIIQELVNNILKHSNAKNAYIMLEEELDAINLIVKDDGDGFDQKSDEEAGIGLNQIKARIKMMNGNFLIESSKGNGTKVIVSIPVIRNQEMALA